MGARIQQVYVKNLFGLFEHTIALNLSQHLTIIHGANGLGKTVILRMIAELFEGRFSLFRRVPFDVFRIDFEDGRALEVRTERIQSGGQLKLPIDETPRQVVLTAYERDGKTRSHTPQKVSSASNARRAYVHERIEHYLPFLSRVAPNAWREDRTGEVLDLDDVLERYRDDLPFQVTEATAEPEIVAEIRRSLAVRLIRTQRLDAENRDRRHNTGRRDVMPAVDSNSVALTNYIGRVREEYGAVSQRLDRSFPLRLFKQDAATAMTVEQVRDKLNQLEERRATLSKLGLFDLDKLGLGEVPDEIIEKRLDVFSIYTKDVEDKLAVFNDIAKRIETLTTIINNRFRYKSMIINREHGYAFRSDSGKELKPSDLSSGEQHELVLLHELIFNTQQCSLILIDEPEISLHLVWQQEFLSDLKKIIELSGFDVLIATHSADIIGPNWNLTVELKGPTSSSRPDDA